MTPVTAEADRSGQQSTGTEPSLITYDSTAVAAAYLDAVDMSHLAWTKAGPKTHPSHVASLCRRLCLPLAVRPTRQAELSLHDNREPIQILHVKGQSCTSRWVTGLSFSDREAGLGYAKAGERKARVVMVLLAALLHPTSRSLKTSCRSHRTAGPAQLPQRF
jgi:hypothetical protein